MVTAVAGEAELHAGRVDPRVGSAQKIYKYWRVGPGPCSSSKD